MSSIIDRTPSILHEILGNENLSDKGKLFLLDKLDFVCWQDNNDSLVSIINTLKLLK